MNKYFQYILDTSIVYFSVFIILGCLGSAGILDKLVPNYTKLIWSVFNFGYILYWIYWFTILLGLIKIITIEKKRVLLLITLVVFTSILYIVSS